MKKLLLIISFMCICIGCTKSDDGIPAPEPDVPVAQPVVARAAIDDSSEAVVFGRPLTNPYTVANMQSAYANLQAKSSTFSEITITQTHRYIQFMPQDALQLEILEADTTLCLYAYPLDYEILSEGTHVTDRRFPCAVDGIPYRYAAVPVDKQLPAGVRFTQLAELFIPEELPETRAGGSLTKTEVDLLVEEAERLAGNDPEPSVRASAYQPAGRLQVWDDAVQGYIPLKGAKVFARRWFTIHTGISDANGYYACDGTFKRPANYSICWERADWDIRSGTFGQAYYNGPKQTGEWNLDINGGRSLRYAVIHRAAYRYWGGNIDGLDRPIHSRKVKICYYHEDGDALGDYWASMGVGVLPDIRIYGSSSGIWRTTPEIFGTTTHELAHAAHLKGIGHINFWLTDLVLTESWARYAQQLITDMEYEELGCNLHEYESYLSGCLVATFVKPDLLNMQHWHARDFNTTYTSLFIDLADNNNQRKYAEIFSPGNQLLYVNDQIYGTPSRMLQDILYEARSVRGVKNQLKLYSGSYGISEETLDQFFEFFISL